MESILIPGWLSAPGSALQSSNARKQSIGRKFIARRSTQNALMVPRVFPGRRRVKEYENHVIASSPGQRTWPGLSKNSETCSVTGRASAHTCNDAVIGRVGQRAVNGQTLAHGTG